MGARQMCALRTRASTYAASALFGSGTPTASTNAALKSDQSCSGDPFALFTAIAE